MSNTNTFWSTQLIQNHSIQLPTTSKKVYGCKWTWEAIKHFTKTQNKIKQQRFYCSTFKAIKGSTIISSINILNWVERSIGCIWVVHFTSVERPYIWATLSFDATVTRFRIVTWIFSHVTRSYPFNRNFIQSMNPSHYPQQPIMWYLFDADNPINQVSVHLFQWWNTF